MATAVINEQDINFDIGWQQARPVLVKDLPKIRHDAIYIAAKFEARAVIRAIAKQVESLGYEVTSKWITREETHLPQHLMALDDLDGVDKCNLFILDTTYPGGSGREVEFGYAMAKNKRIWIVGPTNNVFHVHPDVRRFGDWQQVIVSLEKGRN